MRDLGSPVHSKKLMKNVLEEFLDKARIVIVYKENRAMACSFVIGFKKMTRKSPGICVKGIQPIKSEYVARTLLCWNMPATMALLILILAVFLKVRELISSKHSGEQRPRV